MIHMERMQVSRRPILSNRIICSIRHGHVFQRVAVHYWFACDLNNKSMKMLGAYFAAISPQPKSFISFKLPVYSR